MKIIDNYCSQPRRYADSEGFLKIELEPCDNREEIIKKYQYDNGYAHCIYSEKESTDTILVFHRWEMYCD